MGTPGVAELTNPKIASISKVRPLAWEAVGISQREIET